MVCRWRISDMFQLLLKLVQSLGQYMEVCNYLLVRQDYAAGSGIAADDLSL